MAARTVIVETIEQIIAIFGSFDANIKMVEEHYNVRITSRELEIKIEGDSAKQVNSAEQSIKGLRELAAAGEHITDQNVGYIMDMVDQGEADKIAKMQDAECICISSKGKPIKAKTYGQKQYVEAISSHTITMGIGPAGTGKTYLAVAMAVAAFRDKQVSRIIITRPAVEVGEKLGFLPGDLQTKVDPYLRPLHDALFEIMGTETYHKLLEKGTIEVAPLAYMRGRTLDDSFIILDEAQNTTPEQMKMFLTRLGFRSKIVVTGDITQIDLPDGKKSGLIDAMHVLGNVKDIAICRFTELDVVRHRLVQKIVAAYEKALSQKGEGQGASKSSRGKMMEHILYFENEQEKLPIDENLQDVLRKCVSKVLENEGIDHLCEVTINFVDEERIRALNLEFRAKDMPTDVLSFPMAESVDALEENPENGAYTLGDVVICTSVAYSQSVEFGHSITREIAFLTVHSLLHLLGYDHVDSEEDYQLMMDKRGAGAHKFGHYQRGVNVMRAFFKSFRCALKGLSHCAGSERNFRIHLVVMMYVIVFSFFYSFTKVEYAVLALLFGCILSAEAVNTSLETIANLHADSYNRWIKVAKDIAAAAVFLLAAAAVVIGLLLFWHIASFQRIFHFFVINYWYFGIFLLSLVFSGLFIGKKNK